ncbi:MAG: DUF2156 domain-containing protein [Simkaniaceae bacterium]|nr:DUF2156 domain-containing protein [Simkaniaceae bacterium]
MDSIVSCNFLDRLQLVKLVRKWACINTDGLLDQTTQIFSVPHIEGFIGYRIELGNAVVCGDPVCNSANKIGLAKEFERYCLERKLKVVYIIVSEEFANLASEHLSFSLIEFGRKFVLDPFKYVEPQSALLRKKIRQSSRQGIEIQEYMGDDPTVEASIEEIATTWIQNRKGIQIYLCTPNLFKDRQGKRWFYALHAGKIIGFVLLNQLESRGGWLLNNVMISKETPSGLSEHLVVSALQTLAKENCRFVLIGPVPAKTLGKITDFGKIMTALARLTFKALKKICYLDGHEVFWGKFDPELRSSYLLFPKKQLHISTVIALLRALNISRR